MSQAELARQMADRGWPYHPQTVHRVERGQRKLSFGEAADIAAILDTSIDRLAWEGAEASAVETLNTAGFQIQRHAVALRSAVQSLLAARHHAQAMLRAVKYESRRVDEARELLRSTLERLELDRVVARGVEMYEEGAGTYEQERKR